MITIGQVILASLEGPSRTLVIGCGVLLAAILVMGVVLLIARSRYQKRLRQSSREEAFSLKRLEQMRDEGQISREEFSRLRQALLGLGGEKPKSLSSADGKSDDGSKDSQQGCRPRRDEESDSA